MKIISNKKLNLYIIVGIVFVFVFGVTYAFFTSSLNVEGNINQIVTETGTLELNYLDGDYVTGENVYPGWSANKTIVVTNIGSLDAYYKIYWKELTNNFEQNELVLNAVCTSYEHYGEANQVISGSCNDIEETPISNVAGSIKENIGVEVGFTHVYYFTFTFKEMSSLQNYNQGKTFGGVLNIDDSYGLYTMNGTLLNSEGEPLASTLVSLSNGKSATTNAQGRFTIEEVDEGNYQLTIGEVTDSLTLETGREIGSSGNTITSNIENKEINVTIQIGDGLIIYNVTEPFSYDLNMLALYVDGVKVNSLDNTKNYTLISSACTNGETVIWDNYEKAITVKPMTSATKCTINFNKRNKLTIYEQILYDNNEQSDSLIDFSKNNDGLGNNNGQIFGTEIANSNGLGLYYTSDLTKTEGGEIVYYYRGAVENNHLIFAGYCWRIVRTNEDGSVRLRYNGTPIIISGNNVCPTTMTDVGINNNELVKYNQTYGDNTYVGYMMGQENQCVNTTTCAGTIHSTLVNAQSNTYDSNIKNVIDDWYENNIVSKGESVTSKVANAIYCNDRSIGRSGTLEAIAYTSNAYGNNNVLYGSLRRIRTGGPYGTNMSSENSSPQFKCQIVSRDGFTLSVANGGTIGYGNNKLKYPIGLLTSDEIVYAGGGGFTNSTYYLYTTQNYWTMTPSSFCEGLAILMSPTTSGGLGRNGVNASFRVLPTLSILNNTIVDRGTGEYNSPYIIE